MIVVPFFISADDDDDDINYILSLAGQVPELILEDAFEGTRQSLGRQLGQTSDKEVIILGDLGTLGDAIPEAAETTTVVAAAATEPPTTTIATIPPAVVTESTTTSTGRELTTEAEKVFLTTTLYVNDTDAPETFVVVEATSGVPLPDFSGGIITTTSANSQTITTVTDQENPVTTETSTEGSATVSELPSPNFTVITGGDKGKDINSTGLGKCDDVYAAEAFTLKSPNITDAETDCTLYVKKASDDICEVRYISDIRFEMRQLNKCSGE